MEDSTVAILVVLNNLLHDFAVAGLFTTLVALKYISREVRAGREPLLASAWGLVRMLNRVVMGCWIVIILGGIVRMAAYEKFEWNEAAGRGQIAALIVKHIVLISLVVWGTVTQLRLRKMFSERVPE